MSISLGLNLDTLRSLRLLNRHAQGQSIASARLSSGSRINQASDDAAGLAVAAGLSVKQTLFSRAMLNISDGVSALSIAEGAVSELSSVTDRLLELAQQAANGSLSSQQRVSLQKESDQLTQEFNRLVGSTSLNGNDLLTGSLRNMRLHIGVDGQGSLETGIGTGLSHNQWDKTNQSGVQLSATSGGYEVGSGDFDGDGDIDLATTRSSNGDLVINLQNSDGSFTTSTIASLAVSSLTYLSVGDIDGDGDLDVVASAQNATGSIEVFRNNGQGVFTFSQTEGLAGFARNVRLADFNGDSKLDIATAVGNSGLRLLFGNGNGTFQSEVSYNFTGNIYNIDIADMDNDGDLDIVSANSSVDHSFAVYSNNGSGVFTQTSTVGSSPSTDILLADFDRDGIVDVVNGGTSGATLYRGLGQGKFDSGSNVAFAFGNYFAKAADLNGDGYLDLYAQGGVLATGISYRLGNGDGSFGAATKVSNTTAGNYYGSAAVDINNDGVLDILGITNSNRLNSFISNTTNVTTIGVTTLARVSDARAAIDALTLIKSRISRELSALGSSQSRLASAFSTAAAQREAMAGAEGGIKDADVAQESASLLKNSILQQTSLSVIAQSQQQSQIVLRLLQF